MTRVHLIAPRLCLRPMFLASVVLLLVVAGAGLAACAPPTAPIIGHDCGRVNEVLDQALSKSDQTFWIMGDASGPENCLWQAYQHCQTATLVFDSGSHGVDDGSGSSDTITVQQQQGGCTVSDASQWSSHVDVSSTVSAITTHPCASLRQSDNGLTLTCGALGTFQIPRFPARIGTLCGHVDLPMQGVLVGVPGGAATDIVTCFAQAFQTCHDATLIFTDTRLRTTAFDMETHTLNVEPQQGTCAVRDANIVVHVDGTRNLAVYSCATVQAQPSGGLLVSRCGAEGDLDIPVSLATPTPA